MKPFFLNTNWYRTLLAVGMVAIVCGLISCKLSDDQTPHASNQTIFGLAPGKGRDLVIANCLRCHSPMLIAAHRLDRPRWEATLTTMKKHGLMKLSQQHKDELLEYLVTHQGPLEQHEARETPWAQPLYRPNPLWK